jgi:hypothetical protein
MQLKKIFDLESWKFTGMLISMWSCAPGVLVVDFICQNYCPWLTKYLQFSACVTGGSKSIWHRVMKVYSNVDQHVKLCTWDFASEFICFCRVIALDLVKICNFQFVSCVAQNVFNLVMKSYRNVGQNMQLCTLGFACGFIQYL